MFVKEYYAVCDVCGKRILLPWCNVISSSSISKLRKLYHWLVRRDGCFVCSDCRTVADLRFVAMKQQRIELERNIYYE